MTFSWLNSTVPDNGYGVPIMVAAVMKQEEVVRSIPPGFNISLVLHPRLMVFQRRDHIKKILRVA